MTIEEFQKKSSETFAVKEYQKEYVELGLRGEIGEVCDKIKKLIRDCDWNPEKPVPEEKRESIMLELGDVMWYAVIYAKVMNIPVGFAWRSNSIELNEVSLFSCKNIVLLAIGLANEVSGRPFCMAIVSYVASIANEIGYTLEEVCQRNYAKLQARVKKGTLHGSGDYR